MGRKRDEMSMISNVRFRLSASEKEILTEASQATGDTVSGFIRSAAMSRAKQIMEAFYLIEKHENSRSRTGRTDRAPSRDPHDK